MTRVLTRTEKKCTARPHVRHQGRPPEGVAYNLVRCIVVGHGVGESVGVWGELGQAAYLCVMG